MLIVCLLVTNPLFAGGDKEQGQVRKIVMKLGHDQMEDTPHHAAAVRFKQLVEEQTGGNVTVNIFPAQQLGSAREMNEGLQIGTVEAVCLPTATFS